MPSYRKHIITGDPIVFAPERADRPNAFGGDDVEICPFCPGHESMTPPELERSGDPWRVRVFPNKFPSVDGHEVIVESAEHGVSFDRLDQADEILAMITRRYAVHRDAAFVSLFRNEGRTAGASIDHPHAQLMPLPFLPPRVAREIASFEGGAGCPLCAAIEGHRGSDLVIAESAGFLRLAPEGSSHPYEQWVVPVRHVPEMAGLAPADMAGFARALQDACRAARSIAPAHNVLFMNFGRRASCHMYAAVIPRLAVLAGFELATGTFIEIIDPAVTARTFR